LSWLPAVGLGCALALEHAWHFRHFKVEWAVIPLLWYIGFTALFTGFPFLFRRRLTGQVIPWAAAALAGPLHFYLVHRVVKSTWPNEHMGLLPVVFTLPYIFGLLYLVRRLAMDAPKRNTLLALFGGAALFFITLIFRSSLTASGSRSAGRWKERPYCGCFIACPTRGFALPASAC